jgi:hypothetical protein
MERARDSADPAAIAQSVYHYYPRRQARHFHGAAILYALGTAGISRLNQRSGGTLNDTDPAAIAQSMGNARYRRSRGCTDGFL